MSEPQGSAPPNEPQQTESASTQLVAQRREITPVYNDRIALFDTARFAHMYRIATAMQAMGTLVPESLRKQASVELPADTVIARCLKVVNVADRWQFDPFMLLDCVSVIHDKICYEGKVIHAAIEQCLDVRLSYDFTEDKGDQLAVIVRGQLSGEITPREVSGTVKQWHRGDKSPWANPADWKRQLRYRGAREWCRAFAPGVLLGVYGDDEFDRDAPPIKIIEHEPPPPPPPREAQHYESVEAESAQQTESVFANEPPPPPRKPVPVKGEKQEPKQARRK